MSTKAYTGAGDKGKTSLAGGKIVAKSDLRVSCYGTLDELNAWIGTLRARRGLDREIDQTLRTIQRQLFTIGAIIANPDQATIGRPQNFQAERELEKIERIIDAVNDQLPPLTNFIIPGGTKLASNFHVVRTVARRAERLLVALGEQEPVDPGMIAYLNRLSSLFFVWARFMNVSQGAKEEMW